MENSSGKSALKAKKLNKLEDKYLRLEKAALRNFKTKLSSNPYIITGLSDVPLMEPLKVSQVDARFDAVSEIANLISKSGLLANQVGLRRLNVFLGDIEREVWKQTSMFALKHMMQFIRTVGFFPAPGVRWDHLILSLALRYGNQDFVITYSDDTSLRIPLDIYWSYLLAWFVPAKAITFYNASSLITNMPS